MTDDIKNTNIDTNASATVSEPSQDKLVPFNSLSIDRRIDILLTLILRNSDTTNKLITIGKEQTRLTGEMIESVGKLVDLVAELCDNVKDSEES